MKTYLIQLDDDDLQTVICLRDMLLLDTANIESALGVGICTQIINQATVKKQSEES